MAIEQDAVATIREFQHKGAYSDIARFAATLPADTVTLPAVALVLGRAYAQQGHYLNAEHVLAGAALDRASAGERLIFEMEKASLRIYRDAAVREAMERAGAALAAAGRTEVAPADRAEGARVHVRILLNAALMREVPRDVVTAACNGLPQLARELDSAGRTDEAWAARLTFAENLAEARAGIEALTDLGDAAAAAGRFDVAGSASTRLAEKMLASAAPSDEIRRVLDAAEAFYAQADHRHGAIDTRHIRANLSIQREMADASGLEECLAAYKNVEYYNGAISTLLDLSPFAHVHGDTVSAAAYRREAIALTETVGMGLTRDGFLIGQIDLLLRTHSFSDAIELSESALAAGLPPWRGAAYELLLGTAYVFIDDFEAAARHGRRAIDLFESAGDLDSASDAAMKVSSDVSSSHRDADFDEAESLLGTWVRRNDERGNAGAGARVRESLAQVKILRFLYSPARRGDPTLLDDADALLAEAEKLASRLPPRDSAYRLGNIFQMRGQILLARGDEEGNIDAVRKAGAYFQNGGFAMEAAGCEYILGAIYLNRALIELLSNFGESETHLRTALTYYHSAGMRGQAADTRYLFARLYTNTAPRAPRDLFDPLLDAALDHLHHAEVDHDASRREFVAGHSVIEIQQGKRALVEKTQNINALAVEILCRVRPDPAEAWRHVQRAKARSLVDLLGMSAAPPARLLAEIQSDPEAAGLVAQERELTSRLVQAAPEARPAIHAQLKSLLEQMAGNPRAGEYLELRAGAAVDESDLASMLAGQSCVCVDWISEGDRLFLLTARPGKEPQVRPLSLPLSEVQTLARRYLSPEAFRLTLRDTPEILGEFDGLVAPLGDLTEREELLILSPTAAVHAVPLHALRLDDDALIARNPVVYAPSLTVLRHCLARREARGTMTSAALFGDPTGDRPEAARLVAALEQQFRAASLLGGAVTRQAFREGVAGRDLVHFQGHAKHDPSEPLESYLALADGKLTASDVFALPGLRADLVTLAACESASSVIAAGDEPLGLIPAFLYAGASSVLATLWKVHQSSAASFMRFFYDEYAKENRGDKARLIRRAMLAVRSTPGFETPYHWAPFVLNGDWR